MVNGIILLNVTAEALLKKNTMIAVILSVTVTFHNKYFVTPFR